MNPQEYKRSLKSWPETPCCAALCLPSTMTIALPCACALALGCLASLLVPPDGALGEEVQLQQSPEPRVARWFSNFGNINKYIEKLFNNGLKKPKNLKKPSNSTKPTPSSTTVHPYLNITNPTTAEHQQTPSPAPWAPAIMQPAEASTYILEQTPGQNLTTLGPF